MLQSRFFRWSATRLALYYSSIFIVTLLIVSSLSYYSISGYLYERLDRHVLERFSEIKNTLLERGSTAAVDMIRNHGPQIRGEETLYILKYNSGVLYRNSDVREIPFGISTAVASVDGKIATPFRIRREKILDLDLSVGVNFDDTNQLLKIEFAAFLSSVLLILFSSLGLAYWVSKFTHKRIILLTDRMNEIAKGNLATRLPVSRRDDDIDALARGINCALDKLEVSVESIRKMSANVAHDLRTPISQVRLAIEKNLNLLRDIPEVAHSLNEVIGQLDDLVKTFLSILRLAEIGSGSQKQNFRPLDLTDVVLDIVEIFCPIFEDLSGEIKGISAKGAIVNGDYHLLRQLLINLVSNSIQHGTVGTKVTINVENRTQGPLLVVSDNGPGIPEQDRKRVFEQFVRLSTCGTGLGLSIVRAIVDLHEAKITLKDNEPGLIVEIAFDTD